MKNPVAKNLNKFNKPKVESDKNEYKREKVDLKQICQKCKHSFIFCECKSENY